MLVEFYRRKKYWPWTSNIRTGNALQHDILGPEVMGRGPYLFSLALQVLGAGVIVGTLKATFPAFPAALTFIAGAAIAFGISMVGRFLPTIAGEEERVRRRIREEETKRPEIVFNLVDGKRIDSISGLIPDVEAVRISDSMEKQAAILREMYTQGLAQARNSFRVSIAFAVIGALVLLGGIGLAIWNAPSTGDRYASIVATTAGIVINLTASLFFVQSNRARRSMTEQAVLLREESLSDRRLNAARELAAAISDEPKRNDVRARLALAILPAEIEGATSYETKTESSG